MIGTSSSISRHSKSYKLGVGMRTDPTPLHRQLVEPPLRFHLEHVDSCCRVAGEISPGCGVVLHVTGVQAKFCRDTMQDIL